MLSKKLIISSVSLAFLHKIPGFSSKSSTETANFLCEDSDFLDLCVKPTSLPDKSAGNGLFVSRDFAENEILGEYRGPVLFTKEIDSGSFDEILKNERNLLQVNEKVSILGRSIVSAANDCVNFQRNEYLSGKYAEWLEKRWFPNHAGCEYNARLQIYGNKAFLVTIERISQGNEVFFDYGFEYWKSFYEEMGKESGN